MQENLRQRVPAVDDTFHEQGANLFRCRRPAGLACETNLDTVVTEGSAQTSEERALAAAVRSLDRNEDTHSHAQSSPDQPPSDDLRAGGRYHQIGRPPRRARGCQYE